MPTKRSSTDESQAVAAQRRWTGGWLAVLGATLLAAAVCLSGTAYAGEWVQVSCVNPNQSSAGSQGWSSIIAGGGYGSDSSTSCGPASPAYALLSSDAGVGVGSYETLRYTPPRGSTLNGGQLDIGMSADGRGENASGTAVAYTPEYAYDGSNVFFQCAAGLSPCTGAGNDFTGLLEIPSGRGGNLYLEAGCGGEKGFSCHEGARNGAWSLIELWWANIRLASNATPAASAVGGTLLAPDARGGRELTLSATDPEGPGVYSITVQVDGQTLYGATPDSDGGQCAPVGDSAGALMFDASQPCKQGESVDLPIETAAVHDGQHTLKVTVTDAAQNASVVYDNTITTHNAPANTSTPMVASSGELVPGSTLSAETGKWTAPVGAGASTYGYQWQSCDATGNSCQAISGATASSFTTTAQDSGQTLRVLVTATDGDGSASAVSAASTVVGSQPPASSALTAIVPGAPNGSAASHDAQLHLAGRAIVTRSFAKRALTITGRLADGSGAPIANATLDIREQVDGAGSPLIIGHATTSANGAFSVHVPAGASRLVLIDYRAFSSDGPYSAQASVRENVSAGVQMHITPRRSAATGQIILRGRVAGPVPQAGVLVEILVRYRGAWEPLRTPRTNANGRFQVAYRFQGALGRFPFRAEVFGRQAGYPYSRGQSATVDVSTY